MSAGIRSGVNWTRLKSRCRAPPSERTRTVLPRPGTPSRSRWPPAIMAISTRRMTSRWPTITRPSSASMACASSWKRSGFMSRGMSAAALMLTSLLAQVREVVADQVALRLRDVGAVDLVEGRVPVLRVDLVVRDQAGVGALAAALVLALAGGLAGTLNVDLLGALGGAAGAALAAALPLPAGAALALALTLPLPLALALALPLTLALPLPLPLP